ncbi:MAG: putative membrane protein [Candidatus Bathyarchaeota archaeon BA2]|nr:MAG: putative membrane protein [Candidatus Bathyarchaeota archaeon BA2]
MIDLAVQSAILISSLALLAWASYFTIEHIEDLMELTGLSEASAGFVILSVLTCLPEITVAGFAVYQGAPGISIGDILGSHVFNIGIVVGLLAVLGSLKACRTDLLMELVDILFLASIIPLLLVILRITVAGPLVGTPLIGVALLAVFVFSIYRVAKKRSPALDDSLGRPAQAKSQKKAILWTLIGAAIVIVMARFAVSSASNIVYSLGILPILMGAKIVAIGTSLPELAFGLTAAKRGRVHLALGDAIGANLITITLVLGFVLLLSPFAVDITAFAEILLFVLATNLILWRYLTKGGVSQIGGIILIIIYVLFQATVTGL